jgi:hypothetical protein
LFFCALLRLLLRGIQHCLVGGVVLPTLALLLVVVVLMLVAGPGITLEAM